MQFVPFRDFKNKTKDAFSAELLAEIPHQLITFMASKNLKPRPRQAVVVQPSVPIATAAAVKVDVEGFAVQAQGRTLGREPWKAKHLGANKFFMEFKQRELHGRF